MKTLMTADGASITLDEGKITEFRSTLRGELIMNDHAAYESARRVWNGNIDRRPALIARCSGVADVQQAVAFARTHSLRLSVRGGGHSAPGYGTNDEGLVIDLSTMKGIRVDPKVFQTAIPIGTIQVGAAVGLPTALTVKSITYGRANLLRESVTVTSSDTSELVITLSVAGGAR
jgi:hypothetical protein